MAVAADSTKTATKSADENSSLGSALCTECGLCCAGALHKAAVLDADEIADARALGLPVLEREKPGFALPCPRLAGTFCTIYESRPRVCSRYKCQLLQNLEAGAIELDEALDKVSTAKSLRRQVEAVMPEGMTLPQARELGRASMVAGADDATAPGDKRLVLQTAALELYLDKHFRNERDGRAFDLTLVGEEMDEPRDLSSESSNQ